ncbi:MAG: hypothetical protein IT438_04725 [Phycisphaerales bacterium]|nr:hypothetical protein [Phycisphaerales bacterium]
MQGRYVFSQCLGTPRLWSFNPAAPGATLVQHTVSGIAGQVLGFGEDADGELLVCATNGLYRLTPPADAWIPDCNHNGRSDECEIADGSAVDANNDGVLDSCTRLCPADFDANGALGVGDVFSFLGRWFGGHADADFNGAGGVTLQDVFDFLAAYFAGC